MQNVNFRTTNPQQAGDRVSAIQTAVYLDEVNHHASALYTAPGAIAIGGKAFLKAGAAVEMTLAMPPAGHQMDNGSDGATMKIIALDAFAYKVKTAAKGINGDSDTATFGGKVGDSITFDSHGGCWYANESDHLGVSLSEEQPSGSGTGRWPDKTHWTEVGDGTNYPGEKRPRSAAPFGGFVGA